MGHDDPMRIFANGSTGQSNPGDDYLERSLTSARQIPHDCIV